MNSPLDSVLNAAPETGGVRFAPSPTGTFHIGNLRTAWISARFAEALSSKWIVRFEDIDRPRVVAGSQDRQLTDMKTLGLTPDLILIQSQFYPRHLDLFRQAKADGVVYPCNCSRKDVQATLSGLASAPHDGVAPVYSGRCRHEPVADTSHAPDTGLAWRFKMSGDGQRDFIIARTKTLTGIEGFTPAYQWACAIDDFDGAYDLIVRSSDLATALPLQRAIQAWMSIAPSRRAASVSPAAFHTSLITQDDGHRLEKRTQGVTLTELLETGWTVPKIIRAFEASFDFSLLDLSKFSQSRVGGESYATLKLSQIL